MNYTSISIIFCLGILVTTVIDSIGSLLSRRLNFNYGFLAPLSFITYTMVSYFVTQKANVSFGLLITFLVCLYDCLVGWKISILLNANMDVKSKSFKMSFLGKVFLAVLLTLLFGVLGSYLAQHKVV